MGRDFCNERKAVKTEGGIETINRVEVADTYEVERDDEFHVHLTHC